MMGAGLSTMDIERNPCDNFGELFGVVQHDLDNFLRRFITVSQTLIFHNKLETKKQLIQLDSLDKLASKKAREGLSVRKVGTTVFDIFSEKSTPMQNNMTT